MNLVILFIPVAWAVVAALIGLILYRSSKALFESQRYDGKNVRRIRFVGSAAIAAGAFLGMKYSTPTELLSYIPDDSFVGKKSELRDIAGTTRRLEEQMLLARACLAIEQGTACLDQVDQSISIAHELEIDVERLAPGVTTPKRLPPSMDR